MLYPTAHSLKSIKPLVIAVSGLLLAACSSTPTTQTKSGSTGMVNYPKASANNTQESAALLDEDSLDELEGLLEATDMTMVENSALLVQRYGNLWDRMRVNFKMNENVYDARIEAQKSWFITRQDYLNRLTARASRYLYHTVREAERRNIPTELALLPVIESSYDPNATSNAAAAGLWQFIPSTGRIYGLNQTSTFDGRRDVIESTRAAYDFLTSLYNQFGSWELALASYNAGPGRIQSAINYNKARGLPTDYWSLSLPTETMNYVPRFMAVAQIVKNPNSYGVSLPAIANRQHFRSVPANVGVSLYDVSSLTGVGYDELRALNPALTTGAIDTAGPSRILIPNDVNVTIDRKISQLTGNGYMSSPTYTANTVYPKTSVPTTTTTTKPGALPSSSADLAAMANSMVKNQTTTYVAPAVTPSVPTVINKEPPLTAAEQRSVTAEMQSANNLPTTSVRVTPNNTIVQEPPLSPAERELIAKQIEQTTPQVQQAINPADGNINLNAIQTQQSVLEAKGETKKLTYEEPPVVIPPASKNATSKSVVTTPTVVKKPRPTGTRTIYRVKRGDTLANIAARMGVNWRDIAEWNQIEPNSALLAGSTLYLYDAKPIAEPKPVERATRPDSYRVQAGDTLTDIANKFNLSLSELAKYNNLPVNYSVRTGQNLWLIPDKMSAASKPAASNYRKPTSQVNTSKYTVRSGDTLLGIADKLNVSAQDIAELNEFNTDYRVQLGQTILVPTTKAQTNYFLAGKSVSHTVQPGESLGSIANDYNISLSELAKANYLKPTAGLIVNQKLVIPQAGAAASTPKAAPTKTTSAKVTSVRDDNDQKTAVSKYRGATETYQVKAGEGLINLAARYNMSPSDLAALNNLKPNANLLLGQRIKVPKMTTTYKVKSGDSLTNLARKYGMSNKELAEMNDISPLADLRIGQTIKVPNR